MYDVVAGRRVRRLKGHTDRLTAVHWAADARWLLSASMDGTTRVWDIPAAQCLQVMHPYPNPNPSPSPSPSPNRRPVSAGDASGCTRHRTVHVTLTPTLTLTLTLNPNPKP